uniref:Small ribosomal subunit protein mS23 n=1 Tax=Setaria digitata TaxID=48799 RepID=A0A915PBG5_9BILA
MAQFLVRKETAGSIFYRVTGLLRSGQMKWKKRPLWYDVYAVNPPNFEPSANVSFPGQKEPIRKLYYKEDIIMARFYKEFRSLGAISISNEESESLCKKFIDLYETNEKMWPKLSDEELYLKTLVMLNEKCGLQKSQISEQKLSLVTKER